MKKSLDELWADGIAPPSIIPAYDQESIEVVEHPRRLRLGQHIEIGGQQFQIVSPDTKGGFNIRTIEGEIVVRAIRPTLSQRVSASPVLRALAFVVFLLVLLVLWALALLWPFLPWT